MSAHHPLNRRSHQGSALQDLVQDSLAESDFESFRHRLGLLLPSKVVTNLRAEWNRLVIALNSFPSDEWDRLMETGAEMHQDNRIDDTKTYAHSICRNLDRLIESTNTANWGQFAFEQTELDRLLAEIKSSQSRVQHLSSLNPSANVFSPGRVGAPSFSANLAPHPHSYLNFHRQQYAMPQTEVSSPTFSTLASQIYQLTRTASRIFVTRPCANKALTTFLGILQPLNETTWFQLQRYDVGTGETFASVISSILEGFLVDFRHNTNMLYATRIDFENAHVKLLLSQLNLRLPLTPAGRAYTQALTSPLPLETVLKEEYDELCYKLRSKSRSGGRSRDDVQHLLNWLDSKLLQSLNLWHVLFDTSPTWNNQISNLQLVIWILESLYDTLIRHRNAPSTVNETKEDLKLILDVLEPGTLQSPVADPAFVVNSRAQLPPSY